MLKCKNIEHFDWSGWDIALFAAGSGPAKEYAPKAAAAGCVVIGPSGQAAVPRDITLWEWLSDPATWTGPDGIWASLQETVLLCAITCRKQ